MVNSFFPNPIANCSFSASQVRAGQETEFLSDSPIELIAAPLQILPLPKSRRPSRGVNLQRLVNFSALPACQFIFPGGRSDNINKASSLFSSGRYGIILLYSTPYKVYQIESPLMMFWLTSLDVQHVSSQKFISPCWEI